MKIKTAELEGAALDYAVAKCEGHTIFRRSGLDYQPYIADPSTHPTYNLIGIVPKGQECHWENWCRVPEYHDSWELCGPIIEREEISIRHTIPAMPDSIWQASPSMSAKGAGGRWQKGSTPLVAAMRCYVYGRLGDEVDIPEELL